MTTQSSDDSRHSVDEFIPASNERFAVAVGWSFAMNTVQTVATLATAFILAGILGPEAYGTVALALIFIALLEVLTQQGLVPALIQRPGLTRRHLDTAFWVTMVLSLVLTGAGLLLSGWWASLNNAPDSEPVIQALALMVLVKGLAVVQTALLERQLQFRTLALRTAAANLSGAAVGIGWAVIDASLWALVGQQLVTATVGVAVLWAVTSWRPRLVFGGQEARELVVFASKASLSNVAVFINSRVDALLVGLYFGATAVGLYRLADRLIQSAMELSARPVQRVGLPEFSRLHASAASIRDRYTSLISASTAIGGAIMATIFACAHPLMDTLGPRWSDAAWALQLLCVVGLVRVMTMLNGPAIVGTGHPGAQAAMMWISAALSATSFLVAGNLLHDSDLGVQVVGMAASRAVLYAAVLLPLSQAWLIARYVGVPARSYVRIVAPAVVTSTAVAVAGTFTARWLTGSGAPSALALIAIGTITLAVVLPLNLAVSTDARAIAARLTSRARRARA